MAGKAGQCPICNKPTDDQFRPFCSQRCSRIDLAKWLGERYKIDATENDEDEANLPRSEDEE